MKNYYIKFRVHAIQRMFERNITKNEIRGIISNGKVIKDYPDDIPYPSKLILGWVNNRPLHVVVAENKGNTELIIITVYEPDMNKWDSNFERKLK